MNTSWKENELQDFNKKYNEKIKPIIGNLFLDDACMKLINEAPVGAAFMYAKTLVKNFSLVLHNNHNAAMMFRSGISVKKIDSINIGRCRNKHTYRILLHEPMTKVQEELITRFCGGNESSIFTSEFAGPVAYSYTLVTIEDSSD